ncbi:MAG: Gfo/Idh/MocA family oxidoreductase [Propionicimonas sp.]|uniref:Gfo/Idh/MocA family protein n=1 Tax=Propionicimonas sp. TaxID=1955623 RepID=UPI003D12A176
MAFPQVLPTSRVPELTAAPPLRWGILAPGWIAGGFASALRSYTRQELVAVGSRTRSRAEEFASRFGIPNVHEGYRSLVEDPQVDAVYVASPHSQHAELALLAIEAGKHVLVEKPFTRNAAEARTVVDAARARGVALMEAMWTRFLPRHDIVRQLLADGALGELEFLAADHGQPISHVPRMQDPALAGGALLDLGIYPVSFACFVLGIPGAITASGTLTAAGVDRQVASVFGDFAGHPGVHAQVSCTMGAKTPTTAVVTGSEARIELDGEFYAPGSVRVVTAGGERITSAEPELHSHHALAFEGAHFAQLVADGRTESPLLPLDETVAIMDVLDRIRGQVGVVYPGE